ncbi:hypothetical protein P9939_27135, partial [Serratia nevei]|uniref:hypothetical protein n=1 Tax=Serratia nevei TaxID=2703794 RepID=UPI0025500C01
VILVGLAIDQIAQSGLSSLSVIYYSAQLFSASLDEFAASCADALDASADSAEFTADTPAASALSLACFEKLSDFLASSE